jgi:hypothetical protein
MNEVEDIAVTDLTACHPCLLSATCSSSLSSEVVSHDRVQQQRPISSARVCFMSIHA